MREWLTRAIESSYQLDLSEESRGYLLGRGMRPETIEELRVCEWITPEKPCPDAIGFGKRFGTYGGRLQGNLVFPVYSPTGKLLGFEARSLLSGGDKRRYISDFRLQESRWSPFFIGLTPGTVARIWNGAPVVLVEGTFDKAPVEWLFPDHVVLALVTANLSKNQCNFLTRFCRDEILLCFDHDEQGSKCRDKAIYWLEKGGAETRAVAYRGGKDPGDIWDKGGLHALRHGFYMETEE